VPVGAGSTLRGSDGRSWREPWPLVGRDGEAAVLVEAIRDGRGAALTGDLGVGKTRLADHVAGLMAAEGWAVSAHVATEARERIPFAVFASLLDGTGAPEDPLQRLLVAAEQVTERFGGQVLVQVDDAQWLDDESMAFLQHLAEAADVRFLFTVRSTHERAPRAVSLVRQIGLDRLQLQPLSRIEVSALVLDVLPGVGAGEVLRLWELTAGNPLLLREVVSRALERGDLARRGDELVLPSFDHAGLADVVDARLDDLEPGQLEVLELVAVGSSVPVAVIEELVSVEDLVELERRHLVTVEQSGRRSVVVLAHPIYGELVRARLGAAARRLRRAQLLGALDQRSPGRRSDLVLRAVWGLEHGEAVDAQVLLTVARQLTGVLPGEDVDAAGLPTMPGGALAAAAAMARAAATGGAGFEGASTWYEIAVHRDLGGQDADDALALMADLAGTPHERARVVVATAGRRLRRGDSSTPAVIESLQQAQRTTAGEGRSEVRSSLAMAMTMEGRDDEAEELARQVLADPEATPRARHHASSSLGAALVRTGRPEEALAVVEAALAHPDVVTDQWAFGGLVFSKVSALASVGRVREAHELAAQCVAVAEGTENDLGRLLFGPIEAQLALGLGRPLDALATVEPLFALSSSAEDGELHGAAHAAAAHALALLGRTDEAEAHLELARSSHVRTTNTVFGVARVRAEAWVAVAEGRQAAAVSLLGDTLDAGVGGVPGATSCLHDLVRLGERGHASQIRIVLAGSDGGTLWATAAAHAEALDGDDPLGLLEVADDLEHLGVHLVAAEACAQAAVLHLAAGARAAAGDAERRSQALAAECQGARTPGLVVTTEVRSALTKREVEVARLAARGRPDREIAEELCLSVRTVETYLYRIYAKLGVDGRSDLASHPEL
jgi:DNA-binding CsgD family transcriptional regulator